MKNKCDIAGCGNSSRCRGWCQTHYCRWLKYGDPLILIKPRHNKSDSPEHRSWAHMIQRCINPKNDKFQYYGGRGVTVCDRWRNSFTAFYEDMGDRPIGTTLDRINTNGDYEPSNCRWATGHQQTVNQRISSLNTSGFKGISYDNQRHKWFVRIGKNGKNFALGRYNSLEEALNVRKEAELRLFGFTML